MDDPKSEKVALFRYGLIATLVLERLSRGELMRRARELAALRYDIPFSARTTISVGTLLKWARRHRNGGLEALEPKPRKDRGQSRPITDDLRLNYLSSGEGVSSPQGKGLFQHLSGS